MVFDNGSDSFSQISISRYAIIFPTTYSPDSSFSQQTNHLTVHFAAGSHYFWKEGNELTWVGSFTSVSQQARNQTESLRGQTVDQEGQDFLIILNIIYF